MSTFKYEFFLLSVICLSRRSVYQVYSKITLSVHNIEMTALVMTYNMENKVIKIRRV